MNERNEPPRLTTGQAIVIGIVLLLGFALIPNRFSLVWLVVVLGAFGLLLNTLFQLILRWATRNDNQTIEQKHDHD